MEKTTKAFAIQEGEDGASLIEVELPVPTPGQNEVVIAVKAAGVTPTELRWFPTTHNKDGSPRRFAVPGHEFSGTVTAVGSNVSRFKIDDDVFGMNDWFQNGATAEFCVSDENSIVRKPASVSDNVAAATPIAALTAWQGLVERAKIKRGDRVLIVGASGSVGFVAVQIAALYGCTVFASAAVNAKAELKRLGCQEVLDYRSQPFQQYLRDIDVVFDTVGGDTLACAKNILASHARLIAIAAGEEDSNDPLIKAAYFIVEPSATQLDHIAKLIEQSKLQPAVKAVLPFARAGDAYLGKVHAAGFGKLVLAVGFEASGV